jgi:choice-of-anchor A domain-containing protein
MTKHLSIPLLALCLVVAPGVSSEASLLGAAADYNVFMFGNIAQSSTDVEGRVAAGGNVYYGRPPVAGENLNDTGFAVASRIISPDPLLPELVVGGNLELRNGSVGDVNNQQGRIYAGGSVVAIGNADKVDYVGYGGLTGYNPINFEAEKKYLRNLSSFWGSLSPTGLVETPNSGQIFLTGGNPYLNIFNWDTSGLGTDLGFFLNVPIGSTVLINITDADNMVSLNSIGFYIAKAFMSLGYIAQDDTEAMEKYHQGDLYDDYPNSKILFNFAGITNLAIDLIEINGSILAPWADILFAQNSHVDGHLIGMNLLGNGESHHVRFDGDIPAVPEPATFVLLGGGLAAIAVLRRRLGS